MPDTQPRWTVYRDRETGRQVEHNPCGWFYVDGMHDLDEDEEPIPVPQARVERVEINAPDA